MQIKGIASDTLNFILETSKSIAPGEFSGLLQENDGIITEVLVLPGTESSEQNTVLNLFMMPNITATGSIHSHPGPNRKPSKADLLFFSKTGNCHIIICYPYDRQSWTCYDNEGNIRKLQVLDVKFEDFEEANLDGANFEGANLEGIDFKKANLEEADLVGTNLEETDLEGANLEGANLKGANLKIANLKGADFEGANLREANLKKANLVGANLKDAYLREANLEKANLEEANLELAFLGKAYGLSLDQLSKVKTLYNAKLDDKFLIPLKEKYHALFESL